MMLHIDTGDELPQETAYLIGSFTAQMVEKLIQLHLQAHQGEMVCWEDSCRQQMFEQIRQGDHISAANFITLMWMHGWPLIKQLPVEINSDTDQLILGFKRMLPTEVLDRLSKQFKAGISSHDPVILVTGYDDAFVISKPRRGSNRVSYKFKNIEDLLNNDEVVSAVDSHLEAVLQASGSSLEHYSMDKTIEGMRSAMISAMLEGINTHPEETHHV
ncbi:hypothetical protein [Methylobacillus flagellatus]|uniref:hypothetical protein n=1 Tax=Methylobacillus flagellatus TaxID=405 RepID=UPI0010F47B82|nr:hypothetical protein [Methylobacillus flagellatus]